MWELEVKCIKMIDSYYKLWLYCQFIALKTFSDPYPFKISYDIHLLKLIHIITADRKCMICFDCAKSPYLIMDYYFPTMHLTYLSTTSICRCVIVYSRETFLQKSF